MRDPRTNRWHIMIELNGKKLVSQDEFLSAEQALKEYKENVRPKVLKVIKDSNVEIVGQNIGGYVVLEEEEE